jgi:uncharacterized protein
LWVNYKNKVVNLKNENQVFGEIMKLIKCLLAVVTLSFTLNAFAALTDEEYMEFTEALTGGNVKVVKKYVEGDPTLVNQKFFAWEPLQMAASKGRIDVVKYLVSKGADKNYVHPASHNTAFHMAAFIGDTQLMKYLASVGVDVNVKLKGDVSLVRYFREEHNQKMVDLLTELGTKDDGCQEEKCF